MDTQLENNVPLLPFGEPLRLLVLGSSLNSSDLRLILNKRGIYIKDGRKENTIPILANILLSPREFDVLKNKQQFRESTIKVSDALTAWDTDSAQTVQQALPDEIEPFMRDLIPENSPYQLTDCGLQINHSDEVTINFSIKKQDWTKDVFSSTSVHDGKLTISKSNKGVVTYKIESTAPETKDFSSKLQTATHSFFQEQGAIAKDSTIQKVIANYFENNAYIFEFLRHFIDQRYDNLTFERVSDIDVGINQKLKDFPQNFLWLKGNIDKLTLHGNRIDSTDVMKLGELGILVFGEIEADFKFDYPEAKGTCTIKFGFPNFDDKKGNIEFEAKIARISLYPAFLHVSKEKISKNIIQDFQKNKHQVFEQFVIDKKANSQKRNSENQFEFDGYGW